MVKLTKDQRADLLKLLGIEIKGLSIHYNGRTMLLSQLFSSSNPEESLRKRLKLKEYKDRFIHGKRNIKKEALVRLLKKIAKEDADKWAIQKVGFPKKFKDNVERNEFRVIFNTDLDILSFNEFQEMLREAVVRYMGENNLHDYDKIDVSFSATLIKDGIESEAVGGHSGYTTIEHFSLTQLVKQVEKIIQSNEMLSLNDFTFSITSVRMLVGAGKPRMKVNHKDDFIKKTSVIHVKSESLCMPRSLVIAVARREGDKRYRQIQDSRKTLQEKLAKDLCVKAGVEIKDVNTVEDCVKFETHLKNRIIIWNAQGSAIYDGNELYTETIYLFKSENHYDLITSPNAFLGKSYYCNICLKGYSDKNQHKCTKKKVCFSCKDPECVEVPKEERIYRFCDDCNWSFQSEDCYDKHKENGTCGGYWKCSKRCKQRLCVKKEVRDDDMLKVWEAGLTEEQIADIAKTPRTPDIHRCGFRVCRNCDQYKIYNHECYMQNTELKEPSEKYVFFDFESTQDTDYHEVNLVKAIGFNDEEMSEFTDIDRFVEDILKHPGYTYIAHNGRGYDFHFIQKVLINLGKGKELFVIRQGGKLMYMCLGKGKNKIRFVDSLSFLSWPLKDFKKSLGLNVDDKGYFPHFFNTKENENYIGVMPPMEYYGYNAMSVSDRDKFMFWYEEHRFDEFNMYQEIRRYCIQDVVILKEGCKAFRNIMMELEGCDPFQYTTIASMVMANFKANYLKKDTIAVFKECRKAPAFSKESINWLSSLNNPNIKHALNGGEESLGGFKVDGFDEDSNTIYEFHGCYWHGCEECYEPNTMNTTINQTMRTLKAKTLEKTNELKNQGYEVVEMWGCHWDKAKPKSVFEQLDTFSYESMNPRDAMFGGRTNAIKLEYRAKEDERIDYVDFTSLYPWVNFYCQYIIGHPEILTQRGLDKRPTIAALLREEYFGLVKCRVVAPRGLYFPVLPAKFEVSEKVETIKGGIRTVKSPKLIFSLCRTCATNQNAKCFCNDEQRAFKGTWTTPEIYKAIEKGYKVLDIYEVHHFEKHNDQLFKDYVMKFLKIKQECEGFEGTDQEKQAYIQDYYEHQGIRLDWDKIQKNKGLKAVAKLMLNSLWGKFGENPRHRQYEYIVHEKDLYRIMTSDKYEDVEINFVANDQLEISYYNKAEMTDTQKTANIYVAAFTTAWARLRLYEVMDFLGDRVLYHDTDSIIYITKPGQERVPTSIYLGDLKNELDEDDYITYFVSTGPKSYAYITKNGKSCCKIKGFSLNFQNSLKLNMDSLTEIVHGTTKEVSLVNDKKIVRDSIAKEIKTVREEKKFRLVYNKRVLIDKVHTLPFGY